jgi:ACS family allantoate permease-like MFS transporter
LAKGASEYGTGFKTMTITFSMGCAAPLGSWVHLGWLNRRKKGVLRESGGEDVYIRNEEFMDLTDREQIHFVYSKQKFGTG